MKEAILPTASKKTQKRFRDGGLIAQRKIMPYRSAKYILGIKP